MNTRRRAREAALQALYQSEALGDLTGSRVPVFWEHFPAAAAVQSYANQLIGGTLAALAEIDHWIAQSADRWKLERISMIDRNILRLAIFEMLHVEDVPPKVTINEAVEIAKKYSGENSCAFINGILDRVLRDRRAAEAGGPLAAGA